MAAPEQRDCDCNCSRVSPVYEVIRFECPHKAVILNWEESDSILVSLSFSFPPFISRSISSSEIHLALVEILLVQFFRALFTRGRVLSICYRNSANSSQIWTWAKNIQVPIDIDITIAGGNERYAPRAEKL